MTVYVDNMEAKFQPKHRPGRTYIMCHMIADSEDELHAMADMIGVARKWYQGDHYDIAKSKRQMAIEKGAVAISRKELGCMALLRRAGLPMGDPHSAFARWQAKCRGDQIVFVFGSNLAGRHGSGAAAYARAHYGAIYGHGAGPQGNSYAIPTKDGDLRVLPLKFIKSFVESFILYARSNPKMFFQVTAIGTGLAGYKHEDIAPMFAEAPANCLLPKEWTANDRV